MPRRACGVPPRRPCLGAPAYACDAERRTCHQCRARRWSTGAARPGHAGVLAPAAATRPRRNRERPRRRDLYLAPRREWSRSSTPFVDDSSAQLPARANPSRPLGFRLRRRRNRHGRARPGTAPDQYPQGLSQQQTRIIRPSRADKDTSPFRPSLRSGPFMATMWRFCGQLQYRSISTYSTRGTLHVLMAPFRAVMRDYAGEQTCADSHAGQRTDNSRPPANGSVIVRKPLAGSSRNAK
jgi:hypothetical protein